MTPRSVGLVILHVGLLFRNDVKDGLVILPIRVEVESGKSPGKAREKSGRSPGC